MKYYIEQSLENFNAWSGGKDTLDVLIKKNDCDAVEQLIEETTTEEGLSETAVNDFLWFERDYIAQYLGYDNWLAYEKGEKLNEEEDDDEKDEDMEQALDYIRERLEDYELEEIRAKVNSAYEQHTTPTAYNDFSHIADLLEEYGEDNDYPEGWWMELGDLDDWVVEI